MCLWKLDGLIWRDYDGVELLNVVYMLVRNFGFLKLKLIRFVFHRNFL
jgi:hypothetical protein